ncbi:MAG: flagellar hook-length control protein FliK [Kiloniellales bacterium]
MSGQPATPGEPAQPATPAAPTTAANLPRPELAPGERGAATSAAARQGATGSSPSADANSGKQAGKASEQQSAAQRAEALAERLAGTSAAERNFQAYLQRVAGGEGQSTQAPVADDGVAKGMPAQQQAANAADAPLSAATARPVPTAPGAQIALQVHSALTSHLQRFSIRLEPAELGRVDVRLEFHRDGQVRAMIAAERPETLDLLQKDVHSLERALRDAGTNTAKLSFNFGLQNGGREGDGFAGNQASNGSGSGSTAEAATETDESSVASDTPARRVDGLIDIMV